MGINMKTRFENPNCDGNHCSAYYGKEIRVLPIGGSGNLLLCRACFNYEMQYNAERARETSSPENWPIKKWEDLEIYKAE